ncbi:hypothetical protein [Actinoplanes sp. NPDC051859]|uniref:hypothetical protein n=1 Tax=Actinoplanes sp. NPDC051859 TaxID=3363909 RepID=UPI00378DC01B
MQLDHLRTGWPEQLLTGQYALRQSKGGVLLNVLAGLVVIVTVNLYKPYPRNRLRVTVGDTAVMSVVEDFAGTWAPAPAGPKAIADNPPGPLITLLAHARPKDPTRPSTANRTIAGLFDRRQPFRSRLRHTAADLHHTWQNRPPPLTPTWDVLDNRLGVVIGRLTRPADDVPGSRTVIHDAQGRLVGQMEEPSTPTNPAPCITFTVAGRPVAQIRRRTRKHYLIDVTGAAPAGLDPRLVLACAIQRFVHLSQV